MPDMHGWPISPDLGLLLVRLVEMGQYDAIIEFGSGVSTLIVAQALTKAKLKSIDTSETTDTNFLSFEHLELYFEQTTAFLEQAGLQAIAQLHLTPLVPYEAPDRRIYSYYNCLGLLEQLRAQLKSKSNKSKLLVLVDGPPAATGPRARYPALPILQKVFGDQVEIHILMDDYIRDDERQIVAAWQALQTSNTRVTKEEFSKLEKQACLLKITHSQS